MDFIKISTRLLFEEMLMMGKFSQRISQNLNFEVRLFGHEAKFLLET